MSGELKQHFRGRHLLNRRLTGPGSEKDTRHHEIAIETDRASYLPGDALGVHPHNPPELVDRIVRACHATGDEPVPAGEGTTVSFARALDVYNLTTPSRRLLELAASRGATDLAPLLDKAHAEQLKHYVSGWNDAH